MKNIFVVFLLFILSVKSFAQNRQFNHLYMLNPGLYNPANMDIFTKYGFTMNYLNDFMSSSYSPMNIAAFGYYNQRPFKGFGGSIINDNFGAYNQLEVSGNATYKIFSRGGGGFSHAFGIRVGLLQKSLNTSKLSYQSLDVNQTTDPVLGDLSRVSSMGANIGFGYAFVTNKIDVNVSLPYFFGNRMPFSKVDTIPQRSPLEFGFSEFFISAGYKHRFDNDWYVFYPTIMLHGAKGAPIHAGADLNFLFNQVVWASVGFRSDMTLASSIGVFLDQGFRIVYSYQNAALTKHNGTGWNTELSIGYARTIPDNPFNYKKFTTTTGDVKKAKIFKIKMPRIRFFKKIKGRMKYD
jgi:type IX secretion system PorP/SprF family membrane protein